MARCCSRPLREAQTATLQLLLLPVQVASRFHSPHAWIQNGLERFLQAVAVERRSGRHAALEFLDQYREPLVQAELAAHPTANGSTTGASQASPANNTLLNTNDELYLRGKGGFVFWMLRDMVGEETMQRAVAAYRGGADKDPSYFQKLLQSSPKRDLEWFFDDWVYRDRGLPEFHVESAYTRPLLSEANKSFLVTATIENRGGAGAEVPVTDSDSFRREERARCSKGRAKGYRPYRGASVARQDHGQRWQRPGSQPG